MLLKSIREIVNILIIAVLISLVLRLVLPTFTVEGISMEPSLFNGERVIVSVVSYVGIKSTNYNSIKGDIVVVVRPNNPDIVKRVIGVPGDEIDIREGSFYVNDTKANYSNDFTSENGSQINYPVIVPQNSLFVAGDNRAFSLDSRSFGVVNIDMVLGEVILVIWPFASFRSP